MMPLFSSPDTMYIWSLATPRAKTSGSDFARNVELRAPHHALQGRGHRDCDLSHSRYFIEQQWLWLKSRFWPFS